MVRRGTLRKSGAASVDLVLERLGSFEANALAGLDFDSVSRRRIAAFAGTAFIDRKSAERGANRIALFQCLAHFLQRRFERRRGVVLGHAAILYNGFDEFALIHDASPLCNGGPPDRRIAP